jgi:hypothetical protein
VVPAPRHPPRPSGGGRWIVAFPVFLLLVEIKLHIEERLMLAEFPDDYPRYRKRVPQLVPGLRLGRGILTRPEPPDNYNGRAFYSGPPLSDMLVIVHSLWPRFLWHMSFMAQIAGLGQMNADAR